MDYPDRLYHRTFHRGTSAQPALHSAGYTSYAVVLIRANANTPLNENVPDTIFTLKKYLNREQYENAPLLYGKSYASEPVFVRKGSYYQPKIKEGSPIYRPDKEERKYKIIGHQEEYEYAQNMFFPRMWKERMASAYENWLGGIKGTQVPTSHLDGEGFIKIPTQKENLAYFFTYQLQHMYWRYFLWNFAGRQNEYVVIRPELKTQIKEFYQKHPDEVRQNFGDDPFEIKNILKYWVFSKNQEFHVIPTIH